jgi:hypothetical protein
MSHTSASQSKKQDALSNEMSHTSASQIQKQDAVSNTSAPTWLNNEYNQISMVRQYQFEFLNDHNYV